MSHTLFVLGAKLAKESGLNVSGWRNLLRNRTFKDDDELREFLAQNGGKGCLGLIRLFCSYEYKVLTDEEESFEATMYENYFYRVENVNYSREVKAYHTNDGLVVDSWFINDRYEDEKSLTVSDESYQRLKELMDADDNGLIAALKKKFEGKYAFDNIIEYLNKYEVDYQMSRRS